MKKVLFLSIFSFFIFSANTFIKKTVEVEGEIIFEGMTEKVTFIFTKFLRLNTGPKILDYSTIPEVVKYLGLDGKPIIIKPNQVKGIKFSYEGKDFVFVSKVMPYTDADLKPITKLLELEIDGQVKLLWFHFLSFNDKGVAYSAKEYYVQKEEGELMQPGAISFRRDMKKYFSDCPALVAKIDKREIRGSSIEDAVKFYNNQCK